VRTACRCVMRSERVRCESKQEDLFGRNERQTDLFECQPLVTTPGGKVLHLVVHVCASLLSGVVASVGVILSLQKVQMKWSIPTFPLRVRVDLMITLLDTRRPARAMCDAVNFFRPPFALGCYFSPRSSGGQCNDMAESMRIAFEMSRTSDHGDDSSQRLGIRDQRSTINVESGSGKFYIARSSKSDLLLLDISQAFRVHSIMSNQGYVQMQSMNNNNDNTPVYQPPAQFQQQQQQQANASYNHMIEQTAQNNHNHNHNAELDHGGSPEETESGVYQTSDTKRSKREPGGKKIRSCIYCRRRSVSFLGP
jgi:hypothetical protein